MLKIIVILLASYLIGSLSLSYFLTKLIKKRDLRKIGKLKNIGATNVYYVLGLRYAIITAISDLLKSIVPMIIAIIMNFNQLIVYSVGLAAVLGHIFPFYLNFRGGKGVATLMGMNLLIFYYWDLYSLIFLIISIIYVFYVSPNARKKIITKTKSLVAR